MNENPEPAPAGVSRENKTILYGGIALLVAAVLVTAYWFLFISERAETPVSEDEAAVSEESGFGGEVSKRAEEPARRAADGVPDANPLGEVEANPYGSYKNPFSR